MASVRQKQVVEGGPNGHPAFPLPFLRVSWAQSVIKASPLPGRYWRGQREDENSPTHPPATHDCGLCSLWLVILTDPKQAGHTPTSLPQGKDPESLIIQNVESMIRSHLQDQEPGQLQLE